MTEEEIIRLRGYLSTQSMRRTPAQIVEALQEAYHQFTNAIAALPDIPSYGRLDEHVWSVSEIIEHVYLFLSSYKGAICGVLERGERPPDILNREEILPHGGRTAQDGLLSSESVLASLLLSVTQADPFEHLDITWSHFELGAMHWREWLLFARVHLLDHVRQLSEMRVLAE